MLVGYARISTHTQSPESQKVALMAAGCPETQIFIDVVSGHASSRPEVEGDAGVPQGGGLCGDHAATCSAGRCGIC